MRKEYDINHSECHCKKKEEEKKVEEKCETKDGLFLFGTKTCPNCSSAKKLLEKAKIKYSFVDAEEEVDLTKKFGVKQAPTLVEVKKGNVNVIPNLSNIKKFVEESKK
jgi:ribonucleoside-triphosphate reductase